MPAVHPSAGLRALSDLARSWRMLLSLVAVPLLLVAPSCTAAPETVETGTSPSAVGPTTHTSTAPTGPNAKAYLPDTSTWSFAAKDIDLVPLVDPVGRGIELIQEALDENKHPEAPRDFRDKPSKLGRLSLAMEVSATAIKCLNEHGHLELHAYVDKSFPYSVSVVLVIDAQAYRDVAVSLCAVSDFLLIPLQEKVRPNQPVLSPCVGAHQEGSYVVAWLASTDTMCTALGGEVPPPEARRELRRGDVGPDVANLQFNLNQVGYRLEVDGSFGPKTESALNRFQDCSPYSGAVPGVADEATEAALEQAQSSGTTCPG